METGAEALQKGIRSLAAAVSIEPILKGHSDEQKYLVRFPDRGPQLLRVASLAKRERQEEEFALIAAMHRYGVQAPEAIECGVLEEAGVCYYLLSYLEGEDAREALPAYTEQQQYEIGVAAGRDLAKMHRHPAPDDVAPWSERVLAKHRRYVEAYRTCGITIRDDQKILAFVEQHAHLLEQRPNQFQHDDFHVGNMIVRDGRYVGAIDYNRYDWGDPWHEFVKVALFGREASVPFCVGQLHGYFEETGMPDEFWTLYAVYVAMVVFSSVVWSLRVTPELVDNMIARLYNVLDDHDWFELAEPKWYREASGNFAVSR